MIRIFTALVLSACLFSTASAQTFLFNSNGFEAGAGYVLGNLDGQNTWTVDTPPGTYTVQNTLVAGGAQAVQAVGGATNWIFPPINFTPAPAQGIRIQADIARTVFNTTTSFSYGIDVYNSLTARTLRFGLVNNGGVIQPFVTTRFTAGNFDPSGAVTNVLVGGAVNPSTYVNFDAILNYSTKSFRLLINGVDVGSNIPFVDQTATDLADADFQVSSAAGSSDLGFMDNYAVSLVAVPEPMTWMMIVGGICGSGFYLWRRSTNQKQLMNAVVEETV